MTSRGDASRIDWVLLPLVVAGGAIGVLARYAIMDGVDLDDRLVVMVINLTGSFLLGIVAGALGNSPRRRAFLGTGVLSGFTSYSALAPFLGGWTLLSVFAFPLLIGAVIVVILVGLASIAVAAIGLWIGRTIAERRAA